MTLEEAKKYVKELDEKFEYQYDFYPSYYSEDDEYIIEVSIHWGDWKHDHWYLDDRMYDLGFFKFDGRITESDGSDCYSAIHYFKKNNFPKGWY